MPESASETLGLAAVVADTALKAARNDPNLAQSGRNLSKAVLTATEAINNVLLPLAAFNYGIAKAKEYFEHRFNDDLNEKLRTRAPHEVVSPLPSIAGPALQGLAFSHEETQLKELYLNLLASAMSGSSSKRVHPAFVEVIKQLSPDEAILLQRLSTLGSARSAPFRQVVKDGSYYTSTDIEAQWAEFCLSSAVSEEMAETYRHNLIRLGVLAKDSWTESTLHPAGHHRYGEYNATVEVAVTETLSVTPFGWQLMEVCIEASAVSPVDIGDG